MIDESDNPGWSAAREGIRAAFEESIAVKQAVLDGGALDALIGMAERIVEALTAGGKVMLCGNGGSAADAQHLAAELLVRLRPEVSRDGMAAIALAMDSSTMTACSNDFTYEALYERMVATLGRPGDVLLGISTSGRSVNVNRALRMAREHGIHTFAFLGGDGGESLALADIAFVVPSAVTSRVQEAHITAGHALVGLVEDRLLAGGHIG
ncbi:D-sedoheptulose-7-phosphate isomerase [Endothiovibrio diazotrophicus]